jgi:PAS domain S-box-containing protein
MQYSTFKSRIYRKSQAIILGMAIGLLLSSVVATFINTNNLFKHNLWVNHTYEVKSDLRNIYSNTNAITASLHGFLLSGNTSFERNIKTYKSELMHHYHAVLLLTRDNATQQVRLSQLKTLLDARLKMVEGGVKIRHEQGSNLAVATINNISGEELTNQILELISVLQNEESRLLLERQLVAQQTSNRMYVILSIASLSGLFLFLFLFVILKRQIIEHKRNATLLKQYEAIVEFSNDAIIGGTLNGIIQSWNKGAEKIFGYKSREVIGMHMQMLVPLNSSYEVSEILQRIFTGETVEHFETEHLHKDGHIIVISTTISPVLDNMGKVIGSSKIARDVSERKLAEAEIIRLAFYDLLTNLPNRRLQNDRLNQSIAASKRSGNYSALMFLDLDNFKSLNDTHGRWAICCS